MPPFSEEALLLKRQGADAEFARLAPRIQKLKEAVAEREKAIASMTKELRALRVQVARSETVAAAKQKPVVDDGTLARLEASARADAELIAELRANALADALEIDALRRAAEHDAQQLQDWMRWAWVGQPESDDADDAVYKAKIAMLERAVAYWERRARKECPANTQAVVDRDAAVDFSTRHLRLNDILRLMDSM
jgi:chromosome segregation ATPase